MSVADNKAVVCRQIQELWGKGNMAILDEVLASGFVMHDPIVTHKPHDIESYKWIISMIHNRFSDHQFTIEDQIAEGDKVVTRYTVSYTEKQTGKLVTLEGVTISRIVGGKIAEEWWYREILINHLRPEDAATEALKHLGK